MKRLFGIMVLMLFSLSLSAGSHSKQMVDSMFNNACLEAEDPSSCTSPSSGVATVEGATITWVKDTDGTITLTVDGSDGFTEITIPGAGEFFF